MMFIVRGETALQLPADVVVELTRPTPDYVDAMPGSTDYFCNASAQDATHLEEDGATVIRLRDGWYEAGGGGIAVWGGGRYWELRDTPFTVKA